MESNGAQQSCHAWESFADLLVPSTTGDLSSVPLLSSLAP